MSIVHQYLSIYALNSKYRHGDLSIIKCLKYFVKLEDNCYALRQKIGFNVFIKVRLFICKMINMA